MPKLYLLILAAGLTGATYAQQSKSYEIRQPKGTWQKPGEIRQPTGPWQKPGDIQVPKGIQAIHVEDSNCQKRLTVGADALFEFDKSTLTPDAKETLDALGEVIRKAGRHRVVIEGHTDAIGSGAYNQTLSEKRAQAVEEWLIEHKVLAKESVRVKGFGKTRPAAPSAKADGGDNPEGRQRNRRVEVIVNTCE